MAVKEVSKKSSTPHEEYVEESHDRDDIENLFEDLESMDD